MTVSIRTNSRLSFVEAIHYDALDCSSITGTTASASGIVLYGLVAVSPPRAVLTSIVETVMYFNPKRLRRPEERVGTLANAALPPPANTACESNDSLVRALRARDERAFEDLINRYHSSMLRLAIGFVRSRDEADEVIQETWIAVLTGIDRFENRSSFKTWLFRILENRARTRAKRESRMVPFSSFGDTPQDDFADPVWSGAPSRANTPEDNLLAGELRSRIEAAVAALPQSQHEVLTLRDIEGWSSEEVCKALELSATNQRVLLHRARANVRQALLPYVANRPDQSLHLACA